jgi:hypothetical protein
MSSISCSLGECIVCREEMIIGSANAEGKLNALNCGHVFHLQCFLQWYNRGEHNNCPLCRAAFSTNIVLPDNAPIHQTTFHADTGLPRQDARTLVRERISQLKQKVDFAMDGKKKMARLDDLIRRADKDREFMQYVRLFVKVRKGIPLILPHETSHFGSESREMKFLHYKSTEMQRKYSSLLDSRQNQNKILQDIEIQKTEAENEKAELRHQLQFLKRQCVEQGIEFTSTLAKLSEQQKQTSNNKNNSTPRNSHQQRNEQRKNSTVTSSALRANKKLNVSDLQKISGVIRQRENDDDNHNEDAEGRSRRKQENDRPVLSEQKQKHMKNIILEEFLQEESSRTKRTPLRTQ